MVNTRTCYRLSRLRVTFFFGKNLFLPGYLEETGRKWFFHFIPEESGRNWNKKTQQELMFKGLFYMFDINSISNRQI